MGFLRKLKTWADSLADVSRKLKESRQALADAVRLEDEIRRKPIKCAADLDHQFLSKIMAACPEDTKATVVLASGDQIIIERTHDRAKRAEGSLEW